MQSRTNAQNATATVVRTGATLIKGIRIEQHSNAAPALCLQIFNTASPTVGTTAPLVVMHVPAGSTKPDYTRLAAQFQGQFGGLHLGTGLSYAVTTTPGGLTAPTAGDEPVIIIDYSAIGA